MKKVTIKEYLEEKGIDTSRVIKFDKSTMIAIKSMDNNSLIIGKYRRNDND